MRIISGGARGRKLKEPAGDTIRPTSGRVKESVFNIIQFDIEGRRVLDLFAGTGQLGIEALSRGAASAVFVDISSAAVRIIKENLKICGVEDKARVYNTDALRYLGFEERFDIIFADPPYSSGDMQIAVNKIMEFDKLYDNGIIICETRADTVPQQIIHPYETSKIYRYGNVAVTKIVRNPGAINRQE